MNWFHHHLLTTAAPRNPNSLLGRLLPLQSLLAAAAQAVYDTWEQDEDGIAEDLGAGGICDEIAQAMTDVVLEQLPDVETGEGGQPGDDHAWIIVYDDETEEAVEIDIPPGVYESGSGYVWRKRPDVRFTPEDVYVYEGYWASPENRERYGASRKELRKEAGTFRLADIAMLAWAARFPDFDSFKREYSTLGVRPIMWHLTNEPDFVVRDDLEPQDAVAGFGAREVAQGSGGLMAAALPSSWPKETLSGDRGHVVELDIIALVPGQDYHSVGRGYDEIYIKAPAKVKVLGVHDRATGMAKARRLWNQYPSSEAALRKLWEESRGAVREAVGRSYLDVGHGEKGEHYRLWVLDHGELKVSNVFEGTGERNLRDNHNTVWPDIDFWSAWYGRYEVESGTLSVRVPHRLRRHSLPMSLRDALERKLGPLNSVEEF